jgi:CheY-like chemotaxis protein
MLNTGTALLFHDLRVLVAEDEYLVADEIANVLGRRGATVVGPISTVYDARRLAGSQVLDGAVLDVNLRGAMTWEVADIIMDRRLPLVFVSGYDPTYCPERYARVPWLSKPFVPSELVRAFGEKAAMRRTPGEAPQRPTAPSASARARSTR